MKESTPANEPFIVGTLREVATAMGVGLRTVDEWRRNGMPGEPAPQKGQPGRYDIRAIIEWRALRNKRSGKKPAFSKPDVNGSLDDEDRANWTLEQWLKEERKYKALLLEMKHDVETGELLRRADVEAASIKKIMTVKAALLGLAPKMAPQLYGMSVNEIKRRLDDEVRTIITNFAGGDKEDATHDGNG